MPSPDRNQWTQSTMPIPGSDQRTCSALLASALGQAPRSCQRKGDMSPAKLAATFLTRPGPMDMPSPDHDQWT